MKTLSDCDTWHDLTRHHKEIHSTDIKTLCARDSDRFSGFHIKIDGLCFEYGKHNITADTIKLLCQLATERNVPEKRDALFGGDAINTTENRPALHTVLRTPIDQISDPEIKTYVQTTQDQVKVISETIRSDQKIKDVVHIGIGGSDLGPHMIYEALKHLADGPNIHFLSNVDGAHINHILKGLIPEHTVFIIASKTFTTLETMTNARSAKIWSNGQSRFIAVTARPTLARDFGISEGDILSMQDWIGGRYSLWSAVGLPIAIALGYEGFQDILRGGHKVDQHFKTAPLDQNIPVTMALLGLWYRNFWDYRAHAILPYAQSLHRLPRYIQQLDMESNGKQVDINGCAVAYKTAPVIFGEPGTNAQHAFLQLLHQGTDIVPCDFITVLSAHHPYTDHHTKLLGNALAQAQALMNGQDNINEPHKNFSGNRPSSMIMIDALTPYHLGMLLALYEHKIFVQGTLWDINSFDQWGVELGKTLAKTLIDDLSNNTKHETHDHSTLGLLDYIQGKHKP